MELTKEQKAEQAKMIAAEKAAAAKAAKADGQLAQKMADMEKTMQDMQSVIAGQSKVINSLKGVDETKADLPKIPSGTVKSGKKEHRFTVAAFIFNAQRYLSEDAQLDQDLIDEIVAVEGQGILAVVH